MKRFVQRLLLFACLFWVVNSTAATLLAPRLKLNTWDKYHWLLQKRSEHYNVAFVGSSRVMNSIDPVIVDEASGRSSINLGMGGAGAADQYLILQQFLKFNRVDEVWLQVDYITMMDYFDYSFRDYIWLSYDEDAAVRDVVIQERGLPKYLLWRSMPFLRMMEFSSQYRFFITDAPPKISVFEELRGCVRIDRSMPDNDEVTFVSFCPSESSRKHIDRLVEHCRRLNIKVIAFQSPFAPTIETATDRVNSDGYIREAVDVLKLPFVDFSRDLYGKPELFFDHHHLNSNGVTAFSKMIGHQIRVMNNQPETP